MSPTPARRASATYWSNDGATGIADTLTRGAAHVRGVDRSLRAVIDQVGPCTLSRRGTRGESLVRTIIGQQVSIHAARSVLRRLGTATGGRPTPSRIAALDDATLRGAGVSRQKAGYLRDLAAKIESRELRLHTLHRLSDDDVVTAVTAVKGLGVWSAHMFLIFVLHRMDVLPMGDLGVRKGFQLVYGLRREPSEARMEEIAERWRPYRTIGTWYLWRSLELGKTK